MTSNTNFHTALSHAIRAVADEWIERGRACVTDVSQINDGPCEAFAEDVENRLRQLFGTTDTLRIVGTDNLIEDGALPDDWPDNHVWLELNGRCYDAEAPDGVDTPLDLPFFVDRRSTFTMCGW